VRVGHAHSTELLGHLCDAWGSWRSISLSELGWIRSVRRLLWLWRVRSVATARWRLPPKGSIGTRSKFKSLASISSLLLPTSVALRRRRGSFSGLLNRGSITSGRLTVPFLGSCTPFNKVLSEAIRPVRRRRRSMDGNSVGDSHGLALSVGMLMIRPR
jgi:hypothetical protein